MFLYIFCIKYYDIYSKKFDKLFPEIEALDLNNINSLYEIPSLGEIFPNVKNVIVKSLDSLPKFSFACHKHLENFTVTNSIQRIGKGAFEECAELTKVTINSDKTINFNSDLFQRLTRNLIISKHHF